jgi:hypothetical protein
MQTPDVDPDLAVDEGAFEAFAEVVTAAVLGVVGGDAEAVDALAEGDGAGEGAGAEVTDPGSAGSVVYSSDGDSITTLPDGSVSFMGSSPGGFGDISYDSDLGF